MKPTSTRSNRARRPRAEPLSPTPDEGRAPQAPRALLSPQHETFAFALATGSKQSQAYLQAYPHAAKWRRQSLYAEASKLAATPAIQARVEHLMRQAAEANEVTLQDVVRQLLLILEADPCELVAIHVAPCRFCWGLGHRYQHTDAELAEIRAARTRKRGHRTEQDAASAQWAERGGGGYSVGREPNADCPNCAGAGIPRLVFSDSRSYGPRAAALFAGVEQTRHGIRVKLQNRFQVLMVLARYVGLFDRQTHQPDPAPTDWDALHGLYDQARAKWEADKRRLEGRGLRIEEALRATQQAEQRVCKT